MTRSITSISFVLILMLFACKKKDTAVSPQKSSAKEITSFNLAALVPGVSATIDASSKTVKGELPIGTDLTKLAPTIAVSGKATVIPASGAVQDFTKPVTYTVTAEDGSTQSFVVTLTIQNNGTVYIGNLDGTFYALDALTGVRKWEFKAGDAIQSTPTVVDGVVYFASWDKKLYALDAATGSKKWESAPGLLQPFAAPLIDKGILYYPGEHKFFALDAATGVKKWEFEGDDIYPWQASATLVGGILYGSQRGTGPNVGIFGLDATTGARKWKAAKTHITESSPAIVNEVLYAGSEYEGLNAFDLKTGAVKWSFSEVSTAISSPAVSHGIVYIGSLNNKLYAVDASSGVKKWDFLTENNTTAYSSPFVSNGIVYIGGGSRLYALDAASGTKKWDVQPEQNTLIYSGALVANSLVYIGIGKKMYAFDAATGTKKWEFLTSRTIEQSSPCVVDKDGKVFQAGISGTVQ
jgi:eukaryotic-like serine/threonine-protein kinase